MRNKVLNNKGELTAYGFACGYVRKYQDAFRGYIVRMYSEGGVYHVQEVENNKRLSWKVYDTKKQADIRFKELTNK